MQGVGAGSARTYTSTVSGSPDHFHFFVGQTGVFIDPVETGEEQTVETHMGEQWSLLLRMTEWIYLPSDPRTSTFTKRVIQKSEWLKKKKKI